MEYCKRCQTSSWRASIDESGLCGQCRYQVVNRAFNLVRNVNNVLGVLASEDDLSQDDQVRAAEEGLRVGSRLLRFEKENICTTDPSPVVLLDFFGSLLNDLLEGEGPKRISQLSVQGPAGDSQSDDPAPQFVAVDTDALRFVKPRAHQHETA